MATQRLCSMPGCDKPHSAKGFCGVHYKRLCRHGDPLKSGTANGDLLRFINEVAFTFEGKDCLKWPFAENGNGYGQVNVGGKNVSAHRYICKIIHGDPPTNKHQAAHSCGNGRQGCVNPNHLSWKTAVENSQDKLAHGTSNRGERQGNSKLTEAEVREIISLAGKESQSSMARRFGVTQPAIASIISGRVWGWIDR